MLIIEVQGNQVQFDVEQLIERINGIENCLQLVLMEIVNYLFEMKQCTMMMEIQKIEKDAILAVAHEIIEQFKSRKIKKLVNTLILALMSIWGLTAYGTGLTGLSELMADNAASPTESNKLIVSAWG
jgi:hypothetical protein